MVPMRARKSISAFLEQNVEKEFELAMMSKTRYWVLWLKLNEARRRGNLCSKQMWRRQLPLLLPFLLPALLPVAVAVVIVVALQMGNSFTIGPSARGCLEGCVAYIHV